ncbi:rRNA pseudouridine synthase [Candidatus Gracilibacteria bacterium]|nr:rRNA pseudouridine synthase [Candidatus Gracilibacteria bacterium]
MRLQKYLSQAGICSRRKAEEYIKAGQVTVNGKIAEIGQSVDETKDTIKLLEQAIQQQENFVYYKLNKPRGIVTTCAQHEEKNIIDIVDIQERVFPIGRLDKETTGLILLTNDGRLTNFLIHPRYEHEKEYVVEVFGRIEDEALEKMRNGLFILGSYTKKAEVKRIASGKFSIILKEGRNRQIRRMVEKVGKRVKKLKRIRIENIQLGKLDFGEYKKLSKGELDELFSRIGIEQ